MEHESWRDYNTGPLSCVWKKPIFYPLFHTASQRTRLPTQFKVIFIPSDALINILSLMALTALKNLWSSPGSGQWGLFSSSAKGIYLFLSCCFLLPYSLQAPSEVECYDPLPCTTSYSCCDIILEQGYNAFPGLCVGIRTPVEYSWVRGVQPKNSTSHLQNPYH